MEKIIYTILLLAITTIIMLTSLTTHFHVAAQSNKQGAQSGEYQGIPGPQENANPLTQAPITSLKVKPPNNATSTSPIEKSNITGAPP